MTSQGLMPARNAGLSSHRPGKLNNSKWPYRKGVRCCSLLSLEAVQANEDSSSFQNSCTGLQRFDSPRSNGNKPLSSSSTSKRSGGFTCCVPGCFTNSKRNPEFSFYNFPSGKSEESKELRQKWIDLIFRENFSPTKGHRVCSLHFPGRCKTYMNRLPYI
jgi:hypothetical protein